MTFKRSLALAALLAIGLSSTTGLARRNPEQPLTDRVMVSKTVWMGAKVALLHQYLTKVAPTLKSRISAYDSSEGKQTTNMVMDAAAASWFVVQMKDYFECVGDYVWANFGATIANHLPEPAREFVADC